MAAPIATIDEPSSGALSFLTDNAIASVINDTYNNLSERRKLMGLTNPGTVESISLEVQGDVLLNNYMFSGLRCDLQKFFSISPMFRMQHGFAMGSNVLPPWQLLAMYGNSRVRMYTPSYTSIADPFSDAFARYLLERSIRFRPW